MAAVACGVDKNVFRPRFDPAFQNGLQFAVGDFRLVKGKIVTEKDETEGKAPQIGGDGMQLPEVFLSNLDQTQSLAGEVTKEPLDGRRLAAPPLPPQKDVVGRQPPDKLQGVAVKKPQATVDADQVPMIHHIRMLDRVKVAALAVALPAESDNLADQLSKGHYPRDFSCQQGIGQTEETIEALQQLGHLRMGRV